ncbi:MAG: restriction endonuclease subunit S [Proteobacteria bacterium]|nr:restriction endonuclease subunit S [Pseudomonadota bacterium]
MGDWIQANLGDFITLQRGFDITKVAQGEGPYPVVSSGGIDSFHDHFMVKGPGVVIGRKGTLGTTFFVPGDYWPHDTTLWVKDFKGNDEKFIYYLLKNLPLQRLDSGSANPTLNRNYAHLVKVAAPRLAVQKKIATVLSALDAKIDLNNRINAELEALAKTIYDYWFVQFDFPDAHGRPYRSSGGAMVWNDTLKREIPSEWKTASLWDIATYTNGLAMQKFRPKGEAYLPVIKIKEMSDGFTSETERASPSIPSKIVVNDGDILFSWSATLAVQIWTRGRGALNQHIFKVTSDTYPRSFYYFELVNYLDHFKMMAEKRKTTMGHITLDHLRQSVVVTPPLSLIEQMDERLRPIFDQCLGLSKQNQELTQLRDWLLPLLMNGQVRVA